MLNVHCISGHPATVPGAASECSAHDRGVSDQTPGSGDQVLSAQEDAGQVRVCVQTGVRAAPGQGQAI